MEPVDSNYPPPVPAYIVKPVSYLAHKEQDWKIPELKAQADLVPKSHEYKYRRKG